MLAKLIEYTFTISVAIKLSKNYDVLHLREGDPFLFMLHLLNVFQKGDKWAVVLIGAELTEQSKLTNKQIVAKSFLWLMNGSFWQPVFNRSSKQNKFVYLTENEAVKESYKTYMQGILDITCLSLGVNKVTKTMSMVEARKYLGIPMDKRVFLCFGSPHTGKDWEVIYKALKGIDNSILLQAGNQRLNEESLVGKSANTANFTKEYSMSGKVIVVDKYISEEEKPYYFYASDAILLSYAKTFVSNSSQLWEACRFELPMITSDNGKLKEIVNSYKLGLTFESQNSYSLRDAIMRFMNLSPKSIGIIKKNCRVFSNDFSIDKWAKDCLNIYERILNDE
jgi:glycosyltransferase involved in cell wall biosynthesis